MPFRPHLPGETRLDDVSGLKDRSITTRAALNVAEARNIRKPVLKYLAGKPSSRLAPFDLTWAIKLHAEMFGDVWEWAGKARTAETNLGVPPREILPQLQVLLEDLHSWKEFGHDIVDQSAWLHHRAVSIHPFLNGNGRWARLLANIWLKRHNHEVIRWPENTIGDKSAVRDDYLAAIIAADRGDYEPLFEFHRRFSASTS